MSTALVLNGSTKYILKTFIKSLILDNGNRIDEVINERDLLKLIGTGDTHHGLNRLVTTTKGDDLLCLVVEVAEGVDLVRLLREYKSLDERIIRWVLVQLISILEFLHVRKNVVYKDIKASHVFVR